MYAKNFGLLDFQTFLVLGPLQNYYSHLVFAVMYHYKVIKLHFRGIVTESYVLACKVKTRLMMVNCLLCRQTWCQNFLQSPLRCLAYLPTFTSFRKLLTMGWVLEPSKFASIYTDKGGLDRTEKRRDYCPQVIYTTPLQQRSFQQCLPFSFRW